MNASSISRPMSLVPQLIVFGGVLMAFWQQRWLTGVACIGILGLMNIPLLARMGSPLPLSQNTRVLMSLLLFAWLFLGELKDYYGRFVWWDLFLHGFAGAVIALVGVRLGHAMTAFSERSAFARYAFAAVVGVALALAIGALWEILEFGVDQLLGRNVLKPMLGDKSGLTDTMFDLIADGAGALLACAYGLYRLKNAEKVLEK